VRLRLEKRRGRPVTVAAVEGVADDELKALARELRALCATGGTVKGSEIELQGDQRERLRQALGEKGMRVRGG
jgi:translation initiation factor 1